MHIFIYITYMNMWIENSCHCLCQDQNKDIFLAQASKKFTRKKKKYKCWINMTDDKKTF